MPSKANQRSRHGARDEHPIKVGIIGLGRSGWNIHVAGLATMPRHYVVTAVADPEPARLAEARDSLECATSADPEAVVRHPEVDLVIVASPSHTHVPLGLAALGARKHVVIEKPMASSVAEVDQLTAAAGHARRILTCFHNNRFEASLQVVKGLLNAGRIGEPLLIRRTVHRYNRRSDWQTLRAFGGGELSNQVSHYLDQLLSLVDPREVELLAVDLRHTVSAGDAEDHAKVVLRAERGPLMEIEGSASIALPQPEWFVAGTTGAIMGSRSSLRVRWVEPSELPSLVADSGPAAGRLYDVGETLPWQEEVIDVPPIDRTAVFFSNLHEAINGRAELAITPASVRRQIAILQDARTRAEAAAVT